MPDYDDGFVIYNITLDKYVVIGKVIMYSGNLQMAYRFETYESAQQMLTVSEERILPVSRSSSTGRLYLK